MSVVCSPHNLAQIDELNTQLSVHAYALRLLDDVNVLTAPEEYWFLLTERIALLSQTARLLRAWEFALRRSVTSIRPMRCRTPNRASDLCPWRKNRAGGKCKFRHRPGCIFMR